MTGTVEKVQNLDPEIGAALMTTSPIVAIFVQGLIEENSRLRRRLRDAYASDGSAE
jgi:hypothetical protein